MWKKLNEGLFISNASSITDPICGGLRQINVFSAENGDI